MNSKTELDEVIYAGIKLVGVSQRNTNRNLKAGLEINQEVQIKRYTTRKGLIKRKNVGIC